MILIVVSILYTFLSVCFVVIANRITLVGVNQTIYNNINELDRIGKKFESHIHFLAQKFESCYEQSEYESANSITSLTTTSFFYYLRKQIIKTGESDEQPYRHFLLSDLKLPELMLHELQQGRRKIYLCMLYRYKNFKRIEKEEGLKAALKKTVGNNGNSSQARMSQTNMNQAHYPWDIQLVLIDGSKFPMLSTLQSKYCKNCSAPDIFINGTNEENASCMLGHQRYVLELDFTTLDKKLLLLNPDIAQQSPDSLTVKSDKPIILKDVPSNKTQLLIGAVDIPVDHKIFNVHNGGY